MLVRWGNDGDRSLEMFDDLRRRMDNLFQEFGTGWARPNDSMMWPRATLQDNGNTLMLTADVPGLSEKDVKLTLNQDVLMIEGERKVEVPKGYSVHRQERMPVRFSRSYRLASKVNAEKAQATVKDGVLTVTLPKAPESQPRQIAVRAQ